MHDSVVILKNGEKIVGSIWTVRPADGWFTIAGDVDRRIEMKDCASVITKGERTSINKIGDVDMLAVWEGRRKEEKVMQKNLLKCERRNALLNRMPRGVLRSLVSALLNLGMRDFFRNLPYILWRDGPHHIELTRYFHVQGVGIHYKVVCECGCKERIVSFPEGKLRVKVTCPRCGAVKRARINEKREVIDDEKNSEKYRQGCRRFYGQS